VVAVCFYSLVVFFEEPILRKRSGADYEHYYREVPLGYSGERHGATSLTGPENLVAISTYQFCGIEAHSEVERC